MRVQWAVLARYAEVQGGFVTLVGAGIDGFAVLSFPAQVQAFLAVQLRMHEGERHGHLPVTVRVLDQDLAVVGEPIRFDVGPVPTHPRRPPGWEVGVAIAAPFVAEIDEPGGYDLVIDPGDGKLWTIPFVVQAMPGDSPD